MELRQHLCFAQKSDTTVPFLCISSPACRPCLLLQLGLLPGGYQDDVVQSDQAAFSLMILRKTVSMAHLPPFLPLPTLLAQLTVLPPWHRREILSIMGVHFLLDGRRTVPALTVLDDGLRAQPPALVSKRLLSWQRLRIPTDVSIDSLRIQPPSCVHI